MVLLIDNYDSFSYNLFQLAGGLGAQIQVIRNDAATVAEIAAMAPSHIILSPGPGYPKDAGICEETVRQCGAQIPILGVCLGHQAICEAYGGRIVRANRLMHGKQSRVKVHTGCPLFAGLPEQVDVARYHSLVAQRETLPGVLRVVAEDGAGEIMAVSHREYPVYGVQFHPESILTPQGERMVAQFLKIKTGGIPL